MAFNPLKHAFDDDGKPTPALNGFLDNALKVQRPVVLRWVKRLRAEHPDETPAQLSDRLTKQYLLSVTGGGAAVGGTAVVPGIGTVAALGLSAAAAVGFPLYAERPGWRCLNTSYSYAGDGPQLLNL